MESLVALILIAFGTALGLLILWKLFDVVRKSINKNKSVDDDRFDRLAKAFIQHRKEMERRMQNVEAIVTDAKSRVDVKQEPTDSKRISIDLSNSEDEQQPPERNSNLQNMLNKQRNT